MRRNKLALYLHLVWATWDRQALVTPEIERRVYRNIESEARNMGCTVLALNGMPDHVHMAVSFPTTITVADLVKQVKGVSSHFVNEALKPNDEFKWQGSYGASLSAVGMWIRSSATSNAKRNITNLANSTPNGKRLLKKPKRIRPCRGTTGFGLL